VSGREQPVRRCCISCMCQSGMWTKQQGGVQEDLAAVAQKSTAMSIAVSPDDGVVKGVQEGLSPTEDCNGGYSDAGSLNSEEEQELADYFKEIEEENMVEEDSTGQGEVRSAVLAAILEASHLMSGARRSKHCASDCDVEVALKAQKLKVLKNEGNSDLSPPHVSFDNASMIPNLENTGTSFGNVDGSTSQGFLELTRAVQSCSQVANCLDKQKGNYGFGKERNSG
jgi:hypothetical protein